MIHALGFSQTVFNPAAPGRLCRGRERWIEPVDLEAPVPDIHRLVISGASFQDDSAQDALRGLTHSGVDVASLIGSLFPRRALLAFMEDGHPADIPEEAEGVEAYEGYRAGGAVSVGLVRWHRRVLGVREIRSLLGPDPNHERVRGFALVEAETEDAELMQRIFGLVGMSTLDSPPARYQPSVLPDVLELVRAVILLHRDKHGISLGVYSREPVRVESRLETLCQRVGSGSREPHRAGSLLVPFAIPPMLARWDRALAELRQEWLATREEEFPVPPAPEHLSWDGRRRWRRRRDDRATKAAEE